MIDILLFIGGFLMGAANAFAGAGSLFLLPVLLLAGLDPQKSVMTTAVVGVGGLLSSLFGYSKDLRKVPRQYFWLILPIIIFGVAGSITLISTPGHIFSKLLPWIVLGSIVLFLFQPQLHTHVHRPPHMRRTSPFVFLVIAMTLVAFYGGYFGVGFGFLMLAVLSFTKLKTIYQINAFKNLLGLFIALMSSLLYIVHGDIYLDYALLPILGAITGGYVGARFVHKLSPHLVRSIIIVVGLALVVKLFLDMSA